MVALPVVVTINVTTVVVMLAPTEVRMVTITNVGRVVVDALVVVDDKSSIIETAVLVILSVVLTEETVAVVKEDITKTAIKENWHH